MRDWQPPRLQQQQMQPQRPDAQSLASQGAYVKRFYPWINPQEAFKLIFKKNTPVVENPLNAVVVLPKIISNTNGSSTPGEIQFHPCDQEGAIAESCKIIEVTIDRVSTLVSRHADFRAVSLNQILEENNPSEEEYEELFEHATNFQANDKELVSSLHDKLKNLVLTKNHDYMESFCNWVTAQLVPKDERCLHSRNVYNQLMRHLGPISTNKLIPNLCDQLMEIAVFIANNENNSDKNVTIQSLRYSLVSDIENCFAGFKARIQRAYVTLTQPKKFDFMLQTFRVALVEEGIVSKFRADEGIHLHSAYLIAASMMELGIELTSDQCAPATTQNMTDRLRQIFSKHYTPTALIYKAVEVFMQRDFATLSTKPQDVLESEKCSQTLFQKLPLICNNSTCLILVLSSCKTTQSRKILDKQEHAKEKWWEIQNETCYKLVKIQYPRPKKHLRTLVGR